MKLFVVRYPNDYFKAGQIVEKHDEGYQACEMKQVGNRLEFVRNVGLIYPDKSLYRYLRPIMARGFKGEYTG